jgi:hypothetical protein
MAKRLFFLLLIVAVAGGAYLALRHRDRTSSPAAASSSTTTTVATTAVKAYFLHDNALVAVVVHVPQVPAIARASLDALLAGPPSGYETAIPTGTKLEDVTLLGFAATASFAGSITLTRTAEAQIVDTLTQFPTIRNVAIDSGTNPLALTDSAGDPLGRPATAADYTDLSAAAPIFVAAPARDSTVTNPVTVSGTAVVFEASFVVEVHAGGKLVSTQTIDASVGAPERGTWSTMLNLPQGPVQLLFYEPSAEDGSHLHATEVDLTVSS